MIKDKESLNSYKYIDQLVKSLIAIQFDAYTSIMIKKAKALEKAYETWQQLVKFKINNQVIINYNRGYGRKDKSSSLWTGPMLVIKKTRPDTLTLGNIDNGQLVNCVHTKFMWQFLH